MKRFLLPPFRYREYNQKDSNAQWTGRQNTESDSFCQGDLLAVSRRTTMCNILWSNWNYSYRRVWTRNDLRLLWCSWCWHVVWRNRGRRRQRRRYERRCRRSWRGTGGWCDGEMVAVSSAQNQVKQCFVRQSVSSTIAFEEGWVLQKFWDAEQLFWDWSWEKIVLYIPANVEKSCKG